MPDTGYGNPDGFEPGGDHLDAIEAEIGAAELEVDLLRADPHRFGPGKVHLLRDDRTRCGKAREDCPGQLERGALDHVDCGGCRNGIAADRRHERQARERNERQAKWQAERAERDRQWWARYDAYLSTSEWRSRRRLVLERADGLCEGCRTRRASRVHHLDYRHVTDEMLWELVAVCEDCHQRCHPDKNLAA